MFHTLRTVVILFAIAFGMAGASIAAQTPVATSESHAWWSAWSSCDITPVHGPPEQSTVTAPIDPAPVTFLPWLQAETTNDSDATVVVSLFSGNRPLPVHGSYTDGSSAKWLWILSDDLDGLEVTATNESGTTVELNDLSRVLSSSSGGNEWPSLIDLPEPGCWTFDITATAPDGTIYEGQIVFPGVP